jgi:hypothetical protein
VRWTAISEALPDGEVLIYCAGEYRLGVLVDGDADPGFMDIHSSDMLPWPSHWMPLPRPPSS